MIPGIKHSNTNHSSLLFDSKDHLQISLFHRESFIEDGILETIENCIKADARFLRRTWTIDSLLEALDKCNMESNYQVTPYSRDELKNVIEQLDKRGLIDAILPNKPIKKRITYEREFKLKKEA